MSAILDSSIRAVYFDAVGTLLFPATSVAETYRTIAQRRGAELHADLIRIRLREAFEQQEQIDLGAGWRTSEVREELRWRTIVHEALREVADTDACFRDLWECYRWPKAWTVHSETAIVLENLTQRGIVIGMASNFDARLAGLVAGIPELTPLADRCIISSLVGWRKPSGEFFGKVIEEADCAAAEILFIGDDLRNDVQGAQRAGLRALLFDPAGKSEIAERIGRLMEVVA